MGRELLTADEVRMLDNEKALLFIRGELPILDKKYDIKAHPNYKETPFGGGKPYQADEDERYFRMDDDLSRPYDIATLEILS